MSATLSASRSPSPTPTASKLPPLPSSPTYSYASTANPIASFNLPLPPPPVPSVSVFSKADLEASQAAYSDLLSSAKAYRSALAALSTAASTFGSCLEACARLKEARSESLDQLAGAGSLSNSFMASKGSCTADGLMAASGVHQLIANHQQILSEVVYRSFEVPLLHETDTWSRKIEEETSAFDSQSKALSREIRKMEKEGMKVYKSRKRDVARFREHLVELTGKLDGLTTLQVSYKKGLLREGQEMSRGVVEASAGLVRAEVDIFEALARKGWSGGGLEGLLERGRDLFANDSETHGDNQGQIFSILPQKSILADGAHAHDGTATGLGQGPQGQRRSDSLMVDGERYQSLAGAFSARDADALSIFSEAGTGMGGSGILNRPRGARPFSPPPAERVRDAGPLEVRNASQDVESVPTAAHKVVDRGDEAVREDDTVKEEVNEHDEQEREGGNERGRERGWSITDEVGGV